jgi:hypothetical protein
MKDTIKKLLREKLDIPTFRAPRPVSVSSEELEAIKNVRASDLKIDEIGTSGNIFYLKVVFPFQTQASDSIIVDVQVIQGHIYHPHIHLPEQLQGLGLAAKICQAFIYDFGHLYASKGRIHNKDAYKMWDKLRHDSNIECFDGTTGSLCALKNNPDKQDLIKFVKN